MSTNRSVCYVKPHQVEVRDLEFPKLALGSRKCEHGVVIKVIASNICGSDQHIFRGRFAVPAGFVLGHEVTGEIVEKGRDVEFLNIGDIVSVPFNVSCGRCRNCKTRHPEVCMNVNDKAPLGAFGFDLGGWLGGQSEYMMIPYADYALLKFPDRAQAMENIMSLALISDILPTGYHGCVSAGVGPGSTVYIAGAGPVGRCAAAAARLLGAACVVVGDVNPRRLEIVKKAGFEVANLSQRASLPDQLRDLLGVPEVDCGVDCVGYEGHGEGEYSSSERPETVLNDLFTVVRAGGAIGIPGIYVGADPAAASEPAKKGVFPLGFGGAWGKSLRITTGMAPVLNYSRELMTAILWGRIDLRAIMNFEVLPLAEANRAYQRFSDGEPKKFVFDPHGILAKAGVPAAA